MIALLLVFSCYALVFYVAYRLVRFIWTARQWTGEVPFSEIRDEEKTEQLRAHVEAGTPMGASCDCGAIFEVRNGTLVTHCDCGASLLDQYQPIKPMDGTVSSTYVGMTCFKCGTLNAPGVRHCCCGNDLNFQRAQYGGAAAHEKRSEQST